MNIEFLEIAEKELDEAKEYYDTQHSGLGDQFIIEIISVLERIRKEEGQALHLTLPEGDENFGLRNATVNRAVKSYEKNY